TKTTRSAAMVFTCGVIPTSRTEDPGAKTPAWALFVMIFDRAGRARAGTNRCMGKANVDPAELRRFAADLNRFNIELQGLVSGLHGKMRALEQTWRDQEQRKFSEAFEQTAKG